MLGRILLCIQPRTTSKPGFRPRRADVLQDRLVTDQGLPSPVVANPAEQAVLDRVPLRGTRRVVRYADHQTELVCQTLQRYETLRLLHQIHALLPCILVTADVTESLLRQACQERAYSVIPKPVNKNVVIYTVVRTLVRVYGPVEGDLPG